MLPGIRSLAAAMYLEIYWVYIIQLKNPQSAVMVFCGFLFKIDKSFRLVDILIWLDGFQFLSPMFHLMSK